jgi:hypothetical protein
MGKVIIWARLWGELGFQLFDPVTDAGKHCKSFLRATGVR